MTAEVVQWIDADGASTTLDVRWDVTGRFAPSPLWEEQRVPNQAGLVLRSVRHDARSFSLLLDMSAASDGALRTAMRDMVARMDPTRGNGIIRVTSPLGDQREIVCRYASGLDMDERLGSTSGLGMQLATVGFRAVDPYWRAVSDVTQPFTVGSAVSFFPFFPIRLTASEIAVEANVTNSGDIEARPVWTITGPGSVINFRRLTASTEKVIALTGVTLSAGESIIIDTRQGARTVTKSDGTNLYNTLSSSSSLWPLLRGVNPIRLEMSGTTAASALQLAFRPRYLSP